MWRRKKEEAMNMLKATASIEQIMLAITYLKGLLRDAKRRGDEEVARYIGEIISVYEARLQSQNSNN